jgi:CelD/BcsL family acetyltransferase involved in cellulose biosynthesis
MHVDIITTDDGLFRLADDWNDLLTESRADTVFLTWEWISTWWANFGEQYLLRVLVARESIDDHLVGIAPLMIEPGVVRRLLVLGSPLVAGDYGDFIIRKSREDEVAHAFVETLRNIRGWNVCQVAGIRPDSLMATHLPALAPRWAIHRHTVGAPYLDLPASWEALVRGVSKRFRHKLGWYPRRLERDHPDRTSFLHIEQETGLDQAMSVLFELHQKVKVSRGITGAFADPLRRKFHREIARLFFRRGWLDLYELRLGQETIAICYCYRYRGTTSFYQTGYALDWSQYQPGQQVIAHAIRAAIDTGMQRFDFLRGTESYKSHWTSTVVDGLTLRIPRGLSGHLEVMAYRVARRIRSWQKAALAVRMNIGDGNTPK